MSDACVACAPHLSVAASDDVRSCASVAEGPQRDRLLWEARHTVRKERETERATHLLQHMRQVGWGATHRVRSRDCRPFMLMDGDWTTCTKRVRMEAYAYYFAEPPDEYAAEYVQLEERLREVQGPHLASESTISMADVARAR